MLEIAKLKVLAKQQTRGESWQAKAAVFYQMATALMHLIQLHYYVVIGNRQT